ncbi:hypothetical protein [Actinokineospora sp. NBRC 105648]|nr:hypothetical protein [Actinokineospora sp. NBRC 105648]
MPGPGLATVLGKPLCPAGVTVLGHAALLGRVTVLGGVTVPSRATVPS